MENHRQRERLKRRDFRVFRDFRLSTFAQSFSCAGASFHWNTCSFSIWPKRPFFDRLYHDRRCPTSGFGNRMTFSNNPEKLSLFGGGCNENDRILDLYGGLHGECRRLALASDMHLKKGSTWKLRAVASSRRQRYQASRLCKPGCAKTNF